MRAFRTLIAMLTAVLLSAGLLTAAPASAENPTRIIEVDWTQKDYRTFKLKGTVEEHAQGKILLQRKKCGKCGWKTVKKLKTDRRTRFVTNIYAPRNRGKWLWRIRVNAQDGWARSFSQNVATYY